MASVLSTGFGCANCINYTKEGKPIFISIVIQPILSANIFGEFQCSHNLGRIVQIPMPNYVLSSPLHVPAMSLSITQSPSPLHVPTQDFTLESNSPITTAMYYNICPNEDIYFQSFQLL